MRMGKPLTEARKASQKAYYEAHKEEIKAYKKAHYLSNKERYAALHKAYQDAHRQELLEKAKAYAEAHRDERRVYLQVWYAENRERELVKRRAKYHETKEARKESETARLLKYRREHPEKVSEWAREYQKKNPGAMNARVARRRARKANATPAWANDFFMREAYALAKLRTQVTGIKWQVDHIVPIQSKVVCGLHVENNLQVIPAQENKRKGNRLLPRLLEKRVAFGLHI